MEVWAPRVQVFLHAVVPPSGPSETLYGECEPLDLGTGR